MTKYRDIIRLSSMGLSQRSIASSCQCSRNTVSEVLTRANQKELTWPLPEELVDADLQHLLYPEKAQASSSSRKIPDCEHIHRELATWKIATVQFNYHISVDRMHYSVPYEYIKHKVDVRITRGIIEVFFNHHRICSHPRLYGRPGQYHTVEDHMPEKHKQFVQWNAERFLSWAQCIGPNTSAVIQAIL